MCTGCVLTTGYVLDVYWICTGCVVDAYCIGTGYVVDMYWMCTGWVLYAAAECQNKAAECQFWIDDCVCMY
jgi:hypothetical protein